MSLLLFNLANKLLICMPSQVAAVTSRVKQITSKAFAEGLVLLSDSGEGRSRSIWIRVSFYKLTDQKSQIE